MVTQKIFESPRIVDLESNEYYIVPSDVTSNEVREFEFCNFENKKNYCHT